MRENKTLQQTAATSGGLCSLDTWDPDKKSREFCHADGRRAWGPWPL